MRDTRRDQGAERIGPGSGADRARWPSENGRAVLSWAGLGATSSFHRLRSATDAARVRCGAPQRLGKRATAKLGELNAGS